MPDYPHAIVNELFRNSCKLPAELLPEAIVSRLDGLVAESAPSEVARIKPAEHRVDSLTIYRDRSQRARFAVIAEVQSTKHSQKRWTWPHYVAGVRVKYHCPTYLLVVALDAPVARWARRVISLGHPGFELRPLVISAKDVPIVESAATVKRIPELAVLSALAHKRLSVAEIALAGIEDLAGEQAATYSDAILESVPQLTQHYQESVMLEGYKFRSAFFRNLVAKSKREGRKSGMERGMKEGMKEGMKAGSKEARQHMLLEVMRAKLGELSVKEEQSLLSITEEELLSALLIEVAQAREARKVRAALARAAKASSSAHRQAAPRAGRRAA